MRVWGLLCLVGPLIFGISTVQAQASAELPADFYERHVQPIFNQRCLACHSCFNAPCQLNLQNFEGFTRGANKSNVYQGTRTKSVAPTRMWIDAQSAEEWSHQGFYSINTSTKLEENIFYRLLHLRGERPELTVSKRVDESMMCPDTVRAVKNLEKKDPELAMPYGLPPLTTAQLQTVGAWLQAGAPVPEKRPVHAISKKTKNEISDWEELLNKKDLRHQLVSRYIYEHLFLAHLHFKADQGVFYRLVRSKTACEKGVEEIATRRPNDDPGMKKFFYCLQQFPGEVVMKTHIPYELSSEKRKQINKIFFSTSWKVSALPSYEAGVAENPFKAFHEIPSKSRYEFLLLDAQYHISTFIKGPVCNGSFAVNSIQEQFYVFFIDPKSDNMVQSAVYEKSVEGPLMLPGVWGSDVNLATTPILMAKLKDHRESYRKLRSEDLRKFRPQGYSLEDIWDGYGINNNAALTVFRHDDNAVVLKGAVGDLSKTVFVVDYPLFERLVYNLVVNFDVFGNVSHQLLTRIYMDMIRMEAEELFLQFLPPEQRLQYRREWYRGVFAEAKMAYVFPTVGVEAPTAVRFTEATNTKQQMVEKILFYRMKPEVRGPIDALNWKTLTVPESGVAVPALDSVEQGLRKIASVKADKKTPFAKFFPDTAYVMIKQNGKVNRVFSLIHNKEHENISWILGESLRMDPKADTLTFVEGYYAPYPNQLFSVDEKEMTKFTDTIFAISSERQYQKFVKEFGVQRTSSDFWSHYDELSTHFKSFAPIDFGYIDLTRYNLR